jgi:predicted nucleotidyltransferase
VDLEPDRTLFDLSGLLIDLEAVLHAHVDVVTELGLRARIRERVLREAVPL